jgi:hypothetical protein
MTDETRPTRPVPDDVLVRFLDGEADDAEAARVESARGDARVESRLAALRDATALVSAAATAVPTYPLPPLARPRTFRLARAAAVALLFATGAAAAVPATRALLLDGLGAALTWATGGHDGASEEEATPPGSASVGVPLDGPDFLVEFEGAWPGGTLRIEEGEGPEVRVTTTGAELLVLPGGIRVRPGAGTAVDVTLRAPEGLLRLRVVQGDTERVVDLHDPQSPRTLGLGQPGR